jgi:hypothetical protein
MGGEAGRAHLVARAKMTLWLPLRWPHRALPCARLSATRQEAGMPLTPITLLVDDSCPLVHILREHLIAVDRRPPSTADGRALVDLIPNAFLEHFCDVVARWGIAGKFSIVPAPASRGDIVEGIAGHDPALTREWLTLARSHLAARFDFTPEMLTHSLALDLAAGTLVSLGESDWSQTQTRATLTPYLTRSLALLHAAGIDAAGFTSPWSFGRQVEAEYLAAMAAAQRQVYDRRSTWYFLHIWHREPASRPYLAFAQGDTTVVSIPSTVDDFFWATIDTPRTDRALVEAVVDRMLTADGRAGAIRRVLDAGGWPVIMTHWQSLFSNGLETGLAALDLLGRRVATVLAGEVAWATCSELAAQTQAAYRPAQ